ncbi:hypothetical protein BGZ73_007663 [Actinomortierella ambigua]|nr:hypothetical protein BGZ73_007663 [Actinomortierella ambigua]
MAGSALLPLQKTIKHYLLLSKTRTLTALETKEFESTWERLLPQLQRRIAFGSARAGSARVTTPGVSTNDAGAIPLSARKRPSKGTVPQPEDTTPARSFKLQPDSSTHASSQLAKRKRADSNSKIPVASSSSAILSAVDKENVETHSLKRHKATLSTPLSASSSNVAKKPRGPSKAVPVDDKENEPSAVVQDVRRKRAKANQPVPSHILRENMNIQNGVQRDKGKEKDTTAAATDRPILGSRTNQSRQHAIHNSSTTINIPLHTNQQQPLRTQLVLPMDENTCVPTGRKGSQTASRTNKLAKTGTLKGTPTATKSTSLQERPRLQVFSDAVAPAVSQPSRTVAKVKKEPESHEQLLGKLSASLAATSSRSAPPSTAHNAATAPSETVSHTLQLQCIDLNTPSADTSSKSTTPSTPVSRVVEHRDSTGKVVLEIPGSEEDYEVPVEDPRADDVDLALPAEPFVHSSQTQHVVQASQEDELDENADLDDFIETLPVPEFLQELNEDEDEDADAHDAPTQIQEQEDGGRAVIAQTDGLCRSGATVESSVQKDGVWCLEQAGRQVKQIVCGRRNGWMAIESQQDVDFWKLDNYDIDGSKWKLGFSWPKETSLGLKIVFSEQDSHAAIISSHSNEQPVLTLVSLQDENQRAYRANVNWNGLQVSDDCTAWLTTVAGSTGIDSGEKSDENLLLLGCKNENGAIISLSFPKDTDAIAGSVLQATKSTAAAATTTISSMQLVDNCDELCLTTFSDKLMLWNLSMLERGPLATADISYSSSVSANTPSFRILQAAVPQELYDEYSDVIHAGLLTQRDWPIYVVLEARCGVERAERMTVILMNGQLEVVQRFEDYSNGAACTSSNLLFVESMESSSKSATLAMWDLVEANKLVTLSVKTSEAGPESMSRTRETHLEALSAAPIGTEPEGDEPGRVRKLSLASSLGSGSTLSSPPEGLAISSQSSNEEGEGDRMEPSTKTLSSNMLASARQDQAVNGSVRVGQWMADTATAAEPKNRRPQTIFSVHPQQPWLVMAYSSLCDGKDHGPMVHIVDVSTLLS